MSARRVVITAELVWSDGPKRYDEDDALSVIETEMDGTSFYVSAANGEDETGLELSIIKAEWETK